MMQNFLNGTATLEEMTSQEFMELMHEWKQQLKNITQKHVQVDNIINTTLKKHLKTATNENEIYIMKNYLGSVENE